MELNSHNMKKIRELILFTLLLLIGLWKYALVLDFLHSVVNIAFPFLLGGAIAFAVNVPMRFLEQKLFYNSWIKERKGYPRLRKAARPVSLLLTLAIVAGVVAIVMFVVIPQLGATVMGLGKNIQSFMAGIVRKGDRLFRNNPQVKEALAGLDVDWQKIVNSVTGFLKSGAGNLLNSIVSMARGIVNGLTVFVIAFVFACYILVQKEKLQSQGIQVLHAYLKEEKVKKILDICALTHRTFARFLAGQCLEALILGTMFVVSMMILKLPYALLIGVLIAFTALIPMFGAFIGCLLGAFLILVVNPLQALVFVILFFILQQIEGNLIYPRVVGNSVGLPSIWVLAAVTVGGSLMGIVGMLVFIPLVSVLYTLFRDNVKNRLKKKQVAL